MRKKHVTEERILIEREREKDLDDNSKTTIFAAENDEGEVL